MLVVKILQGLIYQPTS